MGQVCCCVQVGQTEVAMTEKCGRFQEVLEPGCHCVPWIFGSRIGGFLSLRAQRLNVQCETKTKDNVFVTVVACVEYRAILEKAVDAFYKPSDTRAQIQAYVLDVIRSSVPKMNLDEFFEQKNDVARAVKEELEKAMKSDGYEISQTLIVDIVPDATAKEAMNETYAATRMRETTYDKAEVEKVVQIKRAEAEAEAKYLSGLGISRQLREIVGGLGESVVSFSDNVPGTTEREVIDMVMQFLDPMKEIGASSRSSAVFMNHGLDAVRDIPEDTGNR